MPRCVAPTLKTTLFSSRRNKVEITFSSTHQPYFNIELTLRLLKQSRPHIINLQKDVVSMSVDKVEQNVCKRITLKSRFRCVNLFPTNGHVITTSGKAQHTDNFLKFITQMSSCLLTVNTINIKKLIVIIIRVVVLNCPPQCATDKALRFDFI